MYKEEVAAEVVNEVREDPNAWKIEHTRKCEVFNEWCLQNGVQYTKIKYPGYFEGGLVGV